MCLGAQRRGAGVHERGARVARAVRARPAGAALRARHRHATRHRALYSHIRLTNILTLVSHG